MPMKRPAASASAAQKRVKVEVDPVQLHCDVIADGLSRSEEMSSPVINMLTAMSEMALRTCKDERHPYQASVVDMINTVLTSVEEGYSKTIAGFNERLAGTDDSRAQREASVRSAEEDLEGKKAATQQQKYSLADDAQAFKAAKEAISDGQAALKKAEKDFDACTKEKDRLEKVVAEYMKPLAEGLVTGDDMRRKAESLRSSIGKLGLDESMLTALPEAIAKEPSARGAFDKSVVSGLQEELEKHIAKKAEEIAAAEPGKVTCAEGLKAAEAAFESAKEKQHVSAAAYNDARNAQKESEAALKVAQQVLADLEPEVKKLKKDLAATEKDLEDFSNGPKNSFLELRERVLPPPAEEKADATEVVADQGDAATPAAPVTEVQA